MFKSIPAKCIQFPQLPKFFDGIWASKSSVLVREMRPGSSPKQSLLGEDQELERRKSSLHHFIILPIFYCPSQDWWRGREGGCHFFLLVGGGGCQKILYDVGGGIFKNFAP